MSAKYWKSKLMEWIDGNNGVQQNGVIYFIASFQDTQTGIPPDLIVVGLPLSINDSNKSLMHGDFFQYFISFFSMDLPFYAFIILSIVASKEPK